MEKNLLLDIVTPFGSVFSEEVDMVIAPGREGEFGILPGHIPFVTTLKIGALKYKKDNTTSQVFINSGFCETEPGKVIILADSAELMEGIDSERAEAARQRAEERLKGESDVDFIRAETALARAVGRLKLVGRY